jgi:hypothetical protein
VNPATVHEHGSEEGYKVSDWVGHEAAGNKSPLRNKSITAAQFHEKEKNVQHY